MLVTINFFGVGLTVSGTYYKGSSGSYEDPPTGSDFEMEEILLGEMDAYNLIEAFDDNFVFAPNNKPTRSRALEIIHELCINKIEG